MRSSPLRGFELPKELRRSLACTNIIENVMGTVRQVRRNVKRWRSASMVMRWTAAAMQEAAEGFRRLKAHKQLPALRAGLEAHQTRHSARGALARQANAAQHQSQQRPLRDVQQRAGRQRRAA